MFLIIAMVVQSIILGITSHAAPVNVDVIVNELVEEYESGCMCDDCYWTECFEEGLNEFDAIFNSLSTKRAKNGAMMISRDGKTYRFCKKG